ncbi:MAG: hypothetical protein CVT73_25580 [Alphaproteobacteria bacterium HGW-Alphaproteobacteria-12]|nr:MAG: hypothetical protein CVT73_25580 [Alphaproteobacteria bacterium HGW-Alphaproteobacteria-12]
MLHILETLTDPGRPEKPNEDALGYAPGASPSHAWVIDGATDVSEGGLLADDETGAHWLAYRASALFAERAAMHGADLRGLVRGAIETLASEFETRRLREPRGRHEWPSAAMVLLQAGCGKLICANFADCGLILLDNDEMDDDFAEARVYGVQHTSREARAISRTAELVAALAPGADPFASPDVMGYLRDNRIRQNSDTGYWILGIDPQAAAHMRLWEIAFDRPVTGLLFSDGFGSIAFDYHRVSPAALLRRARSEGLAAIVDDIRRIERNEDPACLSWPRFKVSDDATAILFRAEP